MRAIEDLPGPEPLPWVGNFHQMDPARMHRAMETWSEQFGPLFRFRIGTRVVVGVADPVAIGVIFRDRPNGFRKPELLESVFEELGLGGVFSANGEAWRTQRKVVMAAFDTRHLKSYFPALSRVIGRFYRRWSLHAAREEPFDLQADLMRFTVDVVAGLAFGVDFNTIESDGETIQTHLNHVFPMLNRRLSAPFKYWRWLKLPADRALDRHMAIVQQEVRALISQARERLAADPALRSSPTNLLEAMLVELAAPGDELNDRILVGNALTMLLAGEDTTANTLVWLIHFASGHPVVMQRLAEEADTALGEAHFAERLEVAAALDFTAATAQETMRLKPVAPVMLVQANEPKVIGDVAIPRGTIIATLMRPGSLDARYFDRPQSFEPERWLDVPGADAPAAARERIAMPFGAGPRICPGRNLALLEIKLVTSMLFRNFQIVHLGTLDGAPIDERLSFTMAPSPLRITLARRSSGTGPVRETQAS
jgi:cytochrome P450